MWDLFKNLPPILIGQSVFTCLDLKSIVRLETAVANKDQIKIFRSFLLYFSKDEVKVKIPKEMTKLKWLQAHNFPITKAIVNLAKIICTFETTMINEIQLIDNCIISRKTLNYLPDSCYEKVFSVVFNRDQNAVLMEVLFSRLLNLRELTIGCLPDGSIEILLQALYRESNNNVLIEKMIIYHFDGSDGSVAEIVKYCPRLQTLVVQFNITEDSLLTISKHCPLLKELDITCNRVFAKQPIF